MHRLTRWLPMPLPSVLAAAMLLSACSDRADRTEDPAPGSEAPSAPTPVEATSPAGPASSAPEKTAPVRVVAAGAASPQAVVQAYATALPGADRQTLDEFWLHAPRGKVADDHVLRALDEVVSLRVQTGAPQPRDGNVPSRLVEVPVQVRAVTSGAGMQHYEGWYRLVPAADGSAWKLQSASVHAVLH